MHKVSCAVFLVVLIVAANALHIGNIQPPALCLAEKETGVCRASLKRYYYDSNTKTCATFVYGGCEGNDNNFETKELCEATCIQGVARMKQ